MNYSFDTLKNLYDKYTIEKDDKSGKTVVVDRKTRELFAFEGEFAEYVKFAHTWVFATRYNQSIEATSISKNKLSDDEYGRAFNDTSRNIYNNIMENIVTCLQESGGMLKCDALIEEVKTQINNPHVEDIIKGLYAKKGGYASFLFWSLQVAGMGNVLEKTQEKANKQERNLAA